MSRGEICARPGCTNPVIWSGKGRPPTYCSDEACRRARTRERVRRHRGTGTTIRPRGEDAYDPAKLEGILDREAYALQVADEKRMDILHPRRHEPLDGTPIDCVSCSTITGYVWKADGEVELAEGTKRVDGGYVCPVCLEREAKVQARLDEYDRRARERDIEHRRLLVGDEGDPEDWGSAAY